MAGCGACTLHGNSSRAYHSRADLSSNPAGMPDVAAMQQDGHQDNDADIDDDSYQAVMQRIDGFLQGNSTSGVLAPNEHAAAPTGAIHAPAAAAATPATDLSIASLGEHLLQQGNTAVEAYTMLEPLTVLARLVKGRHADARGVSVKEMLRHVDILLHYFKQLVKPTSTVGSEPSTPRCPSSSTDPAAASGHA